MVNKQGGLEYPFGSHYLGSRKRDCSRATEVAISRLESQQRMERSSVLVSLGETPRSLKRETGRSRTLRCPRSIYSYTW